MPDNYDRRLKSRKDWEFEYMGEMPKIPKEGDTFGVPKINDQGEATGWDKYHIDSIGYALKITGRQIVKHAHS